jgi:glycosyltransferase involved in cell wall biosynthesis
MNILLINHYAGSGRHGMEYRPYYLAREWVRLGHRVTIAAASYSHVRMQAPQLRATVTEEAVEGIRYLWFKTPGYQGNGVARAVNMLAFVTQLLRHRAWLLDHPRPDAVIASSTYPLDTVPAYHIARKCTAKLVYEVHDLWPLSLLEVGGMSPWHPFIMLLQWAEDFGYRKADRVISMLPKAAGHMRAHGMALQKFVYIPNGIDLPDWEGEPAPLPAEHRAALAEFRGSNRFLVGYAGAHGLANALHTLLDAASLLQDRPVAFLLVGQGPEKPALQQQAKRLGLRNVLLLPPVPKPAIPTLLASLDALYIGLQKTPLFRFGVSPNKLMDYMMAAKPIIQAIDAGNDLVVESSCGISIPPEEPQAVADSVLDLLRRSPAERAAIGQRGKEYVRTHHDYRVLAQRFLQALG